MIQWKKRADYIRDVSNRKPSSGSWFGNKITTVCLSKVVMIWLEANFVGLTIHLAKRPNLVLRCLTGIVGWHGISTWWHWRCKCPFSYIPDPTKTIMSWKPSKTPMARWKWKQHVLLSRPPEIQRPMPCLAQPISEGTKQCHALPYRLQAFPRAWEKTKRVPQQNLFGKIFFWRGVHASRTPWRPEAFPRPFYLQQQTRTVSTA